MIPDFAYLRYVKAKIGKDLDVQSHHALKLVPRRYETISLVFADAERCQGFDVLQLEFANAVMCRSCKAKGY